MLILSTAAMSLRIARRPTHNSLNYRNILPTHVS